MRLKCFGCTAALFALTLGAVELQTAGELLVDLDATTLEGYSDGNNVEAWPNAGTMPDFAFVNTHNKTTRPTYRIRNGAPAIRFEGSSSGSMTNGVPTPDSLTGNNPWTVEAWVAPTKSVTDIRYFLSLSTYKNLSDNALTRAAFRFDQKEAAAVEHDTYTLNWGRRAPEDIIYRPEPGKWYHICVVHEASGYERLYVNGRIASVGNTALKISNADPSFIIISGINQRGTTTWERQGYTDYGHVRIQTGSLTTAQVIANYNAEKEHYGVTDVPDTVWFDGGTWLNGKTFANDCNLVLEGDQPLVFDNGASNAVHFITVDAAKDNGLTIDNGSIFAISENNNIVELGNVNGGTFTLLVPNGELSVPVNSLTLGLYGTGVGVIGGRDDAYGIVNIGSSLRVGHNPGGVGDFTIKTNGIVNITSTLRIADGNDAQGHITIEQGGELTVLGAAYIGSGTGTGVLDVYGTFTSGTPDTTPNIYLTANTASGSGTLNLHPGSVLNNSILRVEGNAAGTTGTVNIDGATIRTLRQRTSLVEPPVIFNIKNSVTFDVPADTSATIRTTINDLTEDGAAEIVKTGPGILMITPSEGQAPSSISSTFVVREGQLTLGNANAFAADCTATIKLEGGTASADYSGGAAALLQRIDKSSVGYFMLHGNNAGENLDFSEYPGLTIVPNGTFTYTGTITPYQNKYVFRPTNGLMVYVGNIADKNGMPASVEIYGATDLDGVTLSGLNDGMSGNISVFKGILGISGGSEAAGGLNTKLYLAEGTALKLDARVGTTFLTTRVTSDSKPATILLTDNSATCNIDLSLFPGCRVGTDKTGTIMMHTGTILPNDENVFLLGGGAVPYYQANNPGFQPSTMTDNATGTTRVEVATPGVVNLSNTANSYSGGTSILDGGIAYVTSDGFGAAPEEFDEGNIFVNGGVIRSAADPIVTLAATRGVKVGPAGAELHPWGVRTLEIPGGLTGEGPVSITDGGLITLSGAHNTFQGPITVTQAAQVLTIGGDEDFSWASTGGISTPGKVVLKNNSDETFNDVISGTGGLTKQGEGRMTLAHSQPYSGATVVEGGTLELASGVSLANTSSFRNNGEVVFDTLDALGTGSISGNGRFTMAGSGDLDAGRIVGSPSFEVLGNASLGIDAPAFGPNSEVKLDDGASMSLGGGVATMIDGFDEFDSNGSAVVEDGVLKLTPNAVGVVGSSFYTRRVRVSEPWTASFTFRTGEHDEWMIDKLGAALVLQGEAAGPDALGSASPGSSMGCTFAKSVGVFMRLGFDTDQYNFYGFTSGGTPSGSRTGAIRAHEGNPIKIDVSYNGTVLHASWDCNGTVRTQDLTVDIKSVIGTDFAWIGFTGVTGEETGSEQTISGFSFRSGIYTGIPGIDEANWEHSNYAPTYTTIDDKGAFELTTNAENSRSATWNTTRVSVNRPFRASFKYRVTDHSETPADGISIALQNYSTTAGACYGAVGGSLGIVYGTPRERTVAWCASIYQGGGNAQCFKFVRDGSFSGDNVPFSGWDLADGADTEFTLTYDLRYLTLTATRAGASFTATREIDLVEAMDSNLAWIGFTGATGGSSARQLVYDFNFAYDEVDLTSRYSNPFVVNGAVQMNLGMGSVGFSNLTLADGAAITASSQYETELELAGTKLLGSAAVTAAEGVPIVLDGTITFAPDTGVLKLTGDVRSNGKVKLELSSLKSIRSLIDLSSATTTLTADDFEIVGNVPPPVRIAIQNGMLRAWRNVSTVLFFR